VRHEVARFEWIHRKEVGQSVDCVVPGKCSVPVPTRTCAAGDGGVRSFGECPRVPAPSGGNRLGKTGRANASEPLMMPRYLKPRAMDAGPGCRDFAVEMRLALPLLARYCAARSVGRVPPDWVAVGAALVLPIVAVVLLLFAWKPLPWLLPAELRLVPAARRIGHARRGLVRLNDVSAAGSSVPITASAAL